MNRLEIHRRVGLTVLVFVVQHLVLPGDDLLGGDVTHFQPAEVWQQLGTDDVVLGGPSVLLEPGFHIRRVEIHEALKGHVQIGAGLVELFALPGLCLPFGLEAPLLGLLALAVPVSIAVDRPPGVCLFFLNIAYSVRFLPQCRPVITSVANLYLRKQIIFERS